MKTFLKFVYAPETVLLTHQRFYDPVIDEAHIIGVRLLDTPICYTYHCQQCACTSQQHSQIGLLIVTTFLCQ